jgi:hypothetical protein
MISALSAERMEQLSGRFVILECHLFGRQNVSDQPITMSVYVNWTAVPGPVLIPHSTNDVLPPQRELSASERDGVGAGYYVIVVILVYGMSIVALIASHIKRKHSKLLEDRQIHKYLKEFQVSGMRIEKVAYD